MKTVVQEIYESLHEGRISDLAEMKEWFLVREKFAHGETWDAAIQDHEARGNNIARSIPDFDDYYEKYERRDS